MLGDQVDVLVGLLEKIYLTLDHYSPVLLPHFQVRHVSLVHSENPHQIRNVFVLRTKLGFVLLLSQVFDILKLIKKEISGVAP